MKCHVEGCNADTRTLSTRGDKRRRECFNGHRFNTLEMPVEDRTERAQIKRDQRLKMMKEMRERERAEIEGIRAAKGTLREIGELFGRSITYVWKVRRGDVDAL